MKSNACHSPTSHLREAALCLAVGDLVRTSANAYPQFHVIALAVDRAWIRDSQHGTDHVVPVDLCRKFGDS